MTNKQHITVSAAQAQPRRRWSHSVVSVSVVVLLQLQFTIVSLWMITAIKASTAATSTTRTTTSTSTLRLILSLKGGNVPWQSSSSSSSSSGSATVRSSIIEESIYADLPPTTFSPTGRLHAVERAVQASKTPHNPRANLLIAIKCPKDNTLVVLSTIPTSPYLNTTITITEGAKVTPTETTTVSSNNDTTTMDNNNTNMTGAMNTSSPETTTTTTVSSSLFLFQETSSSSSQLTSTTTSIPTPTSSIPIFDLTPTCIAGTAGNAIDGQILRYKLQSIAGYAMEQHYDAIESSILARRLADHLQQPTQSISSNNNNNGRMLASHAMIMGNGQLWRIDPTGQFWKCKALVIGRDADRAEETFYHELMKLANTNTNNNDNKNDNVDDDTATSTTGDNDNDPSQQQQQQQQQQQRPMNLRQILENMTSDEAIRIICNTMQQIVWPRNLPSPTTKLTGKNDNTSDNEDGTTTTITSSSTSSSAAGVAVTPIYWQAIILKDDDGSDLTSSNNDNMPQRIIQRGMFLPPTFGNKK